MRIGIHGLGTTLVEVLDEAQIERAATVLVSLELLNGGFCRLGTVKAHDAATAGATARLILDLSLLNLADSSEELY